MCVRKVHLTSFIRLSVGRARAPSPWNNRDPIREELFSVERLEEHARSLAVAQPVTPKPTKGHPLAGRLADNAAVLLDAYRTIAKAIDEGRAITPAAEWLIDNYHLVERQIRDIRSDLPPGYYRQLPKLADGPFAGYPRVLGVAWAFVAHTDSRFDPEMLCRYVRAYQEVQPLTIGELWAVAITLRIVLVENLRRLAERIVHSRAARRGSRRSRRPTAGCWRTCGRTGAGGACGSRARASCRTRSRSNSCTDCAIRIRRIIPALTWLDERLAAQGTTADAVVRDEHQRQGAATVTVRNIITSMRLISDVDWTELFERISLVDDVLASRQRLFRHGFPDAQSLPQRHRGTGARLESHRDSKSRAAPFWRRSNAESAGASAEEDRRGDPGYHLLAGGRRAFEAVIGFRPPLHTWLGRLNRALGIGGYVSAIAAVAAVLLALPLFVAGCRWARRGMAEPARRSGCDPRHRRGGRAGEPRRDARLRRDASARLWTFATAFPRICARSSRCRRC